MRASAFLGLGLRMAWRLAWLERTYAATSLPGLMRSLMPEQIRYARDWPEAERVGSAAKFVVYGLPLAGKLGNCLKLALLRFEQLRRMGIPVVFHLGLKPTAEGGAGHAWLTHHGVPLWEDLPFLAGFTETYRYPSHGDSPV